MEGSSRNGEQLLVHLFERIDASLVLKVVRRELRLSQLALL